MINNVVKLRNINRSEEEIILFQMNIERYFDAAAFGEFKELGISQQRELKILRNFFHRFCTHKDFKK